MGWYRTGSDACYFKNQLTRGGLKPFWTLTFVVRTHFDQDTLYLAHCFPYRYCTYLVQLVLLLFVVVVVVVVVSTRAPKRTSMAPTLINVHGVSCAF